MKTISTGFKKKKSVFPYTRGRLGELEIVAKISPCGHVFTFNFFLSYTEFQMRMRTKFQNKLD